MPVSTFTSTAAPNEEIVVVAAPGVGRRLLVKGLFVLCDANTQASFQSGDDEQSVLFGSSVVNTSLRPGKGWNIQPLGPDLFQCDENEPLVFSKVEVSICFGLVYYEDVRIG